MGAVTARLDARDSGVGEGPGPVVAVISSFSPPMASRGKSEQPLTWSSAPVIGGPPEILASFVAPAHKAFHHGMQIGTYRQKCLGLDRVQSLSANHTTPTKETVTSTARRSPGEHSIALCPQWIRDGSRATPSNQQGSSHSRNPSEPPSPFPRGHEEGLHTHAAFAGVQELQ